MIVYVVLNSKFKEHLLHTFRDVGTFIGCNHCTQAFHENNREDNMELETKSSFIETKQRSPNNSHQNEDDRSPVFV